MEYSRLASSLVSLCFMQLTTSQVHIASYLQVLVVIQS